VSVSPSVPSFDRSSGVRAGLLLSAVWAGEIDILYSGERWAPRSSGAVARRSAANAVNATMTVELTTLNTDSLCIL